METHSSNSFFIPYPHGFMRRVMRLPLWLYRLGWGNVVGLFPFMILTTRGRKTQQPRHTVLEYRRHGSKIYVVSGWGNQTDWVKNALAHPIVTIQAGQNGTQPRRATATLVTDPAEALRALYMFRRRSYVYEVLLSQIGDAPTIDFRTLTQVANRFTVFRLEWDNTQPPENLGVQATHQTTGQVMLGAMGVLSLLILTRLFRR
jgi:deazaflavin-dependent oxidoreductase (nitroreductase family)